MPSCGHKSPNKAPLFVIYSKYQSPQLLTQQLIFCNDLEFQSPHFLTGYLSMIRFDTIRGAGRNKKPPKFIWWQSGWWMPPEHNIPSVHAPFCGLCRVWCDVSGASKNLDQTQTSHGPRHRASSGSGFWRQDRVKQKITKTNSPDTTSIAL